MPPSLYQSLSEAMNNCVVTA